MFLETRTCFTAAAGGVGLTLASACRVEVLTLSAVQTARLTVGAQRCITDTSQTGQVRAVALALETGSRHRAASDAHHHRAVDVVDLEHVETHVLRVDVIRPQIGAQCARVGRECRA